MWKDCFIFQKAAKILAFSILLSEILQLSLEMAIENMMLTYFVKCQLAKYVVHNIIACMEQLRGKKPATICFIFQKETKSLAYTLM